MADTTFVNGTTLSDSDWFNDLNRLHYTLLQDPTAVHFACDGRLTLTSGTPVTTSDVTAAETLYFAPYKGAKISLYDGSANWKTYTFSELSIDVPDATNCYDVFCYDNSGTPTLELTAWTNETTRATALTTQNGVLVKTGATTRRYLGTFYSTTAGNGQIEDSLAKRNLWNYYNRVRRPMRVLEATNSWTYTTDTFRQLNNSTANQLEFVRGVEEDEVTAFVTVQRSNATADVRGNVGIGLDATNAIATGCITARSHNVGANSLVQHSASYCGFPGLGRHYLAALERSGATDVSTWYGDDGGTAIQSGIHGSVLA